MHRQPAQQGQTGRRGIAWPNADHGRSHEIAEAIEPGAALAPLPRRLAISNQPFAFSDRLAAR